MTAFRKIAATSLLVLLFAGQGWAATYYFDATNGNDSNTGLSPEQAYKTIAKYNSYVRAINTAGDSILFKRGESFGGENLIIAGTGTAGSPITFGAYGDSAIPPRITSGIVCRAPFAAASYIVVNDIDVYATPARGLDIGGNDNLTIRRMNVSGCGSCGIEFRYEATLTNPSSNVTIEDVNVYSCQSYGIWGYLGDGSYMRRVVAHDNGLSGTQNNISVSPASGSTLTIEDCEVYNCNGNGFGTAINYADSKLVYNRCSSHNNTESGFIGHGNAAGGLVVYNYCKAYGNSNSGMILGDNSTSNANSVELYNCTVYGNTAYGVQFNSTGTHTSKNNVVWGNATSGTGYNFGRGGSAGPTTSDYNCLDTSATNPFASGGAYKTWAQWQALGYDAHSKTTDPKFRSTTDFHLRSSSPCINVGATIEGLTTDFDGRKVPYSVAPDIGAYEYRPTVGPFRW